MTSTQVAPSQRTETRHHPLGKTCHHFIYHGLSCDQYDDLRDRAAGHCQICDVDEKDTPRGFLVVDHFRGHLSRVIRGMICDKCNTSVMQCVDGNKIWGSRTRSLEARAREYERNSWETPSETALAEMAARTEMLSKFDPRYVRPTYEPCYPEQTQPRQAQTIQVPLDRGPAVLARTLRRHLTPKQTARLAELLSQQA